MDILVGGPAQEPESNVTVPAPPIKHEHEKFVDHLLWPGISIAFIMVVTVVMKYWMKKK